LRTIKKGFVLFFVCLLLSAIWPIQQTYAAEITRMSIKDPYTGAAVTYLIAGRSYNVDYETTKASTTTMKNKKLEYSTDNGATWIRIPVLESGGFWSPAINMPLEPKLVSAKFRISSYFDPLLGSLTYSEKIIGPYKILQPGEITDFTTIPNPDGTVTLKWNDNSNMESYYEITRSGPDGDKKFYVNNTKDYFGPLTYVDKKTDTSKSTFYVYRVTPVIDQYEDEQLGTVWSYIKTKVLKITVPVNLDPIPIPDLDPKIFDPKTPIVKLDLYKNFPVIDLKLGDLDKKPVSSVMLDKASISLKTGEGASLAATVSPADAANLKVKWESSNSQVAEVDSKGKVTGKSPGHANITVTTEMGNLKAVCIVTVTSDRANPPDPQVALTDIAGHKARTEIIEAVERGVVFGYEDFTFRPDGNVTRAEFASMLMRAIKPVDEGAPLSFIDKDKIESWALKPVQQAVKLGIIFGYDDKTFKPNANISHAEMISMVIRASGLAGGNSSKTSFTDDAEIPDWAKPAVSKAEETGIIIVGGLPGGKFAPEAMSTRAEAASAIVRMLKVK